jgi:hypothetical protein
VFRHESVYAANLRPLPPAEAPNPELAPPRRYRVDGAVFATQRPDEERDLGVRETLEPAPGTVDGSQESVLTFMAQTLTLGQTARRDLPVPASIAATPEPPASGQRFLLRLQTRFTSSLQVMN